MTKTDMLEELEMYIRARFKPKSNPAEEAQMLLKRIENLGMTYTWEPELTTLDREEDVDS